MDELREELMKFKYPKSYSRKNVLNEGDRCYEGFALGKVWSWAHKGADVTGHELRDNVNTHQEKFQRIKELSRVIADDFGCEYSTVQYNKNYACRKHIDGKNAGISHIIGLGDYEGGELLIYYSGPDEKPTSVDIKNQFYSFNGSEYFHETAPFQGERHTLVYFIL